MELLFVMTIKKVLAIANRIQTEGWFPFAYTTLYKHQQCANDWCK